MKSIKKRNKISHKGDYGKVLVIAGEKTMAGAGILAAHAAYRAGSGLVYVMTEACNAVSVHVALPEAIVLEFTDSFPRYDAALIGPGMTPEQETGQLLNRLLSEEAKPIVMDGGALRVLDKAKIRDYKGAVILTPHIGEMADIYGATAAMVLCDMKGYAKRLSGETGAVVVLKAHETVICSGSEISISKYGTPGMATAGSGDVLAGIIVSFLGQGYDPYQAARLGAYVHGRAGELADTEYGENSMMAHDIIDKIKDVFLGGEKSDDR